MNEMIQGGCWKCCGITAMTRPYGHYSQGRGLKSTNISNLKAMEIIHTLILSFVLFFNHVY